MKNLTFLCLLLLVILSFAQSVLISPSNGSKLIEASATNKAVQMSSVSATSAITSPQKGMVFFDNGLCWFGRSCYQSYSRTAGNYQ